MHAEALGVPGQRRFRLLLDSHVGSAVLWVERQHLESLALAIAQLLAQTQKEPDQPSDPGDAVGRFRTEFTVSRLELGHDEAGHRYLLGAEALETPDEATEPVRAWATRSQIEALAEEIGAVLAAGRPRCRLCGAPISGDSHPCPRANGHLPLLMEGPAGEPS
ncbi:MAG: DUF3090 family protein [Chloroflexi bacterium]|nr:DUF3090 family protein [Chloroflexota bacterium]